MDPRIAEFAEGWKCVRLDGKGLHIAADSLSSKSFSIETLVISTIEVCPTFFGLVSC